MTDLLIRRACKEDIAEIQNLLRQVLMVHHNGRPDIFKPNAKKYTDEELAEIIEDDQKPIFVAVDDSDEVLGYAFCVYQQHINDNILTEVRTLYIDDLCVDETKRGMHIGKHLYDYVRIEDIDALNEAAGLSRVKIISPDGASDYMRPVLNAMDEETFQIYIDYHLSICERQDLIGAGAHTLDILRKI